MLENKSPIETFHWLVRAHSLSARGYCEACEFFEKEKNENNLNLDEKIIIACCLKNINIAILTEDIKEEVNLKKLQIEEFYIDNYDKCAPGTRDYMANYEETMQKEREMFSGLHEYVEKENKRLSKVYLRDTKERR